MYLKFVDNTNKPDTLTSSNKVKIYLCGTIVIITRDPSTRESPHQKSFKQLKFMRIVKKANPLVFTSVIKHFIEIYRDHAEKHVVS